MVLQLSDQVILEIALILALGAYLGAWIHEGSHYLIGKLGDSGPNLRFVNVVMPTEVTHDNIETMDEGIIRLSGLAPILWLPILFAVIPLSAISPHPVTFTVSVAIAVNVVMVTVSDTVAFRDPNEFRKKSQEDGFSGTPLLKAWFDSKLGRRRD